MWASFKQGTKSFSTFSDVAPKTQEMQVIKKKMVVQELLRYRMRKRWQTCAINDQHLQCQEDFAIQALHRNQRHVCGRGLAALWVQPNVAWHFVSGMQNTRSLPKSSHSAREQLLADSILYTQKGLVNYRYARIRFLNPSPLPAVLFVMNRTKCVPITVWSHWVNHIRFLYLLFHPLF